MQANEGAIEFGYAEFPARGACDPGLACCASDVLIRPDRGRAWAIEQKIGWCDTAATGCQPTSDDSPSADVLARIAGRAEAEARPNPNRFVLLITDGGPSCGASTAMCAQAGTEAARLHAAGVKTIVLGVGDEAKQSPCIAEIARQGHSERTGTPAFPWVGDVTQLDRELAAALAPVTALACRFTLKDGVMNPDKLRVAVNNWSIRRDPTRTDGWELVAPGSAQIQVYGPACTKLLCSDFLPRDFRAWTPCTQCGREVTCH
jgi:hypothetical protein